MPAGFALPLKIHKIWKIVQDSPHSPYFKLMGQFDSYIIRRQSGFTQSAITCSKLKTETLEQGVKYKDTRTTPFNLILIGK